MESAAARFKFGTVRLPLAVVGHIYAELSSELENSEHPEMCG
jgi:hypothetical protein